MKAKVVPKLKVVMNSLDIQIAMVEAGEGVAVIPSFGVPVCRNRKIVMSRLVNPVVTEDFHQIRNRGRKLPAEAEDFARFFSLTLAYGPGRRGFSRSAS